MGMARALLTLGTAVLVLAGCDKVTGGGNDASADFARAALERNDKLTVVAFDKNENTFTVRLKDSGELRVISADQVIGSVPGTPATEAQSRPVSDVAPSSGETTASSPSQPAEQTASTGDIARPADHADAQGSSPPSSTSGTAVITDPRTGNVLASANGGAPADPGQEAAAAKSAGGKKVLASGPGYSITAGDRARPSADVRLASRSSSIPSPARGVAVEKRYEPIICQGQRLIRLDGRNLEFDSDAVIAQDGCEIHITNSHIIAHGGVGLSARASNVHIKNSVIEGDIGSVSASAGSQVYTQQSTFKGLSRRLDTATFHDLGGTVWNN